MSSTFTKWDIRAKLKEARATESEKSSRKSVGDRAPDLVSLLLALLPFWIGLAVCSILLSGCSTPYYATDNPVLLRFPGVERKSDQIEGVLRPWERMSLILEKGDKGRNVKPEEQAIILQQLIEEYHVTGSPNIRRTCIDALAKITTVTPNREVEKTFSEALVDPNLNVRISGIEAWGCYCRDKRKEYPESRRLAAEKLCTRFRELPYSIAAGAKQKNDEHKDMRLAIIRNLGTFHLDDSPELISTLRFALDGEQLDDGALQLAAMQALEKTTGKKYGLDARQWTEYIAYLQEGRGEAPRELSTLERIHAPDLPLFK